MNKTKRNEQRHRKTCRERGINTFSMNSRNNSHYIGSVPFYTVFGNKHKVKAKVYTLVGTPKKQTVQPNSFLTEIYCEYMSNGLVSAIKKTFLLI